MILGIISFAIKDQIWSLDLKGHLEFFHNYHSWRYVQKFSHHFSLFQEGLLLVCIGNDFSIFITNFWRLLNNIFALFMIFGALMHAKQMFFSFFLAQSPYKYSQKFPFIFSHQIKVWMPNVSLISCCFLHFHQSHMLKMFVFSCLKFKLHFFHIQDVEDFRSILGMGHTCWLTQSADTHL